ncbi:MAG TPA: hypothetical protein VF153_09100 [Candidatus Limnocylindria bacterium]
MSDVLRVVVGAFGALMVVTALLLFSTGGVLAWSGIYPMVFGLIAIATALFERTRYWPGRRRATQGALRATEERFIDPTTGQRTRVWIDPSTGERQYLPEGERPQK